MGMKLEPGVRNNQARELYTAGRRRFEADGSLECH